MAKVWFWRLSIASIITVAIIVWFEWRRPQPDSIIGQYKIPAGLSTICGVDKDGLMIHMNIILYDSQGKYLMQNTPQTPYACASIPGMKAGQYWVRLFRGDK